MSDYDLTARRTEEPPKRFKLIRDEDETGISGTGVVAFGVTFSDGVTVTHWNGHGGRTRIEWIDSKETSGDVDSFMVPDGRLQAIADEWRVYQEVQSRLRTMDEQGEAESKLNDLLEALVDE